MKKWYVYELVNLMGTIEYVGETIRPEIRLKSHLYKGGKFYKRNDIVMNVVAEFDKENDAFNYQCELQQYYGFETDRNKYIKGAKIAGTMFSKPIKCFTEGTNFLIGEYTSLSEASKELNICITSISQNLNKGKKLKSKVYFEYK